MPLNTLSDQAHCGSCLSDVQVPQTLWQQLIAKFDNEHDTLEFGQAVRGELADHGFSMRYEYSLGTPSCEKCGQAHPVDDLGQGPASNFACVACGDPASSAPVPGWLALPTAKRIYCPQPGEASSIGKHALDAPAKAQRAIAMTCPQCAGALQVTAESKRMFSCKYCQAEIFMPDPLWRSLHPVKTVEPFSIGFEGLSEVQQDRGREEALIKAALAERGQANWPLSIVASVLVLLGGVAFWKLDVLALGANKASLIPIMVPLACSVPSAMMVFYYGRIIKLTLVLSFFSLGAPFLGAAFALLMSWMLLFQTEHNIAVPGLDKSPTMLYRDPALGLVLISMGVVNLATWVHIFWLNA